MKCFHAFLLAITIGGAVFTTEYTFAAAVQPASETPAGQLAAEHQIAPGVWFFIGDKSKGYSDTTVVEMDDYLIVVDANYPGRAKELLQVVRTPSSKPVKYVFDTHAHGDHSYGNSVWTAAGATTMAFKGVAADMDKWEPARWQQSALKRLDLQQTGQKDVQRPQKSINGQSFTLKDRHRQVQFLSFGWGHTDGDGYVWLRKERVLCTGDAAVNGPYNKVIDANLTNWPKVLDHASRLGPRQVLPGHGSAGGPEILKGQAQFLRDLRQAVAADLAKGEKPDATKIDLPAVDDNWVPHSRLDLWQQDIATMALELSSHKPAGSLPHEWK
jgi:cyclase